MKLRFFLCLFFFLSYNLQALEIKNECDPNQFRLDKINWSQFEVDKIYWKNDTNTSTKFVRTQALVVLNADLESVDKKLHDFNQHKNFIRTLADSKIIKKESCEIRSTKNNNQCDERRFLIEYSTILGFPFSNLSFQSLVKTTKLIDQEGFLQQWTLYYVPQGMISLDHTDGYMKYASMKINEKKYTILIYCNYNVPSIKLAQNLANSKMIEGAKNTLIDYVKWLEKN
jgi:hypothetical protein